MDSIAMANLSKNIQMDLVTNSDVLGFNANKYVKFTFKTGYNPAMSLVTVNRGLDKMQDNSNAEDYFNLTQYDLRMKIYANKRLRILNRALVTGFYTKKYLLQTGIIYKF